MIAVYFVPIFLSLIFIFAIVKRKNAYDLFINGSKTALDLIITLFPYIISVIIMSELFEVSGLSNLLSQLLSPLFNFFGVPPSLTKLILIKPFSGNGSLAILNEVITKYGVNHKYSMMACCLFGSSETTFYIATVYYSKCKNKKATKAIVISLIATFISTIFCCFICNFIF